MVPPSLFRFGSGTNREGAGGSAAPTCSTDWLGGRDSYPAPFVSLSLLSISAAKRLRPSGLRESIPSAPSLLLSAMLSGTDTKTDTMLAGRLEIEATLATGSCHSTPCHRRYYSTSQHVEAEVRHAALSFPVSIRRNVSVVREEGHHRGPVHGAKSQVCRLPVRDSNPRTGPGICNLQILRCRDCRICHRRRRALPKIAQRLVLARSTDQETVLARPRVTKQCPWRGERRCTLTS